MADLAATLEQLADEGAVRLLPWHAGAADRRGLSRRRRPDHRGGSGRLSRHPPPPRTSRVPRSRARREPAAVVRWRADRLRAQAARRVGAGRAAGKRVRPRLPGGSGPCGRRRARRRLRRRAGPRRARQATARRRARRRRGGGHPPSGNRSGSTRAGAASFHDARERGRRPGQRGLALRVDRLRLRVRRSRHRTPPEQHARRRRPQPEWAAARGRPPADEHDGAHHRPRRRAPSARARKRGLRAAAGSDRPDDRERRRPRARRAGGDRASSRSPRRCRSPLRGRHRRRRHERARGHGLPARALAGTRRNLYFGGVAAVGLGSRGELEAAGDSRRGGHGVVVA